MSLDPPLRRGVLLAGAAVLAIATVPMAQADAPPAPDEIDDWPVAAGNFRPGQYHEVFFKTPDGWHCGIGPTGGPIGCDVVPSEAPAGTNQTVLTSGGAAQYRHSPTTTFTRSAVDVLPAGQRLTNGDASCGVGHQGTVTCKTDGDHGFTISSAYGVLW